MTDQQWQTFFRICAKVLGRGDAEQNIDRLSDELTKAGIKHRKTELLLEIKLYWAQL